MDAAAASDPGSDGDDSSQKARNGNTAGDQPSCGQKQAEADQGAEEPWPVLMGIRRAASGNRL